jgi:hypothetical protein
VFSPVQREFTIDPRTMFIPPELSLETFLTYTDNTVYDQVFTIVTDGSRATHIFTQPFASGSFRGTLVDDVGADDASVLLRDISIRDSVTGEWEIISTSNNTLTLVINTASIIGRNNAIIPSQGLRRGDHVQVLTNELPEHSERNPGMNIPGWIIMVD